MDQTQVAWVAAYAALGGSAIGALASIVTISVQAHFEAKRHRQEMAVKMAQDDRGQHLAKAAPGAAVPPLAVYVSYYVALLDKVSQNTLTPESVLELGRQNQALFKAIKDAQDTAGS